MSQHDYVIDNQTAAAFRTDLNNALGAIATSNSGASAPTTTYANMLWYDTTNAVLKMRDAANAAWITLFYLDQSNGLFHVLDDTEVVNTSGTQTGLIGDQTQTTWNTGSGTTPSLIAPATLKAYVDNREATTTEYRNNTADKILTTDIAWGSMSEVTLTDGATISWNMNNGIDFAVTLAGNRTLGNPTNPIVGKKGRLRVIQDATGSRTLSFSSNFVFAGGTAPTLTTTASAYDVLYYDVIDSTTILVSSILDVK